MALKKVGGFLAQADSRRRGGVEPGRDGARPSEASRRCVYWVQATRAGGNHGTRPHLALHRSRCRSRDCRGSGDSSRTGALAGSRAPSREDRVEVDRRWSAGIERVLPVLCGLPTHVIEETVDQRRRDDHRNYLHLGSAPQTGQGVHLEHNPESNSVRARLLLKLAAMLPAAPRPRRALPGSSFSGGLNRPRRIG